MAVGGAVLVVDDDRINRRLLSKFLVDSGYRPATAEDGRQALDALAEESFDAVLLDIVMPELDGHQVLRALKSDSRWWHIPVIVISAVDETESIVSCFELGAEDYILKPFDPVLLRARLNGCLARRRFHDLEREYHKLFEEQATELEALNRQVRERIWERVPASPDANPAPVGSDARRVLVGVVAAGLAGLEDPSADADQAVIGMLDDFRQAALGAAATDEGVVVAWAPEALTVVFGGLRSSADPGAAAVGMVRALQVEVSARLPAWRRRTGAGQSLRFGAAVAVGEATVGRVGAGGPAHAAAGPVMARVDELGRQARHNGVVVVDDSVGPDRRA